MCVDLLDKQKLFRAPEKAGSVMEALQQRMAKYKDAQDQAKQEGATSKMKRMGRIVKVDNFVVICSNSVVNVNVYLLAHSWMHCYVQTDVKVLLLV